MRDRFTRVRAFYKNLAPADRGIHVVAAAAGKPAEILLYDEISPWGVTAQDFIKALRSVGESPVVVKINSPGGDVFDGLAMYNALRQHQPGVECVVDGLAASAASIVALAGSKCTMAESSFLMIHNAWCFVMGNRHDLANTAGTLEKIDGQLAAIYAAKTGQTAEEMAAMMDAETWLTAAEAKDSGFCDNVQTEPAPAARAQFPAASAKPGIQAAVPPDDTGADAPPDTAEAALHVQQALTLAGRMFSGDAALDEDSLGVLVDEMQDAHEALTGAEFSAPGLPVETGDTMDSASLTLARARLRLAESDFG